MNCLRLRNIAAKSRVQLICCSRVVVPLQICAVVTIKNWFCLIFSKLHLFPNPSICRHQIIIHKNILNHFSRSNQPFYFTHMWQVRSPNPNKMEQSLFNSLPKQIQYEHQNSFHHCTSKFRALWRSQSSLDGLNQQYFAFMWVESFRKVYSLLCSILLGLMQPISHMCTFLGNNECVFRNSIPLKRRTKLDFIGLCYTTAQETIYLDAQAYIAIAFPHLGIRMNNHTFCEYTVSCRLNRIFCLL